MRRKRQGFAFVAAGAAVALALAGAAVAAINGHAARAATVVKVTEREYHISLSKTALPAGTFTFSIHNAGKIAHQLDLSGSGIRLKHVASIAPGTTRTITVKLTGGKLSIWCPLPGHAADGMKASLRVQGATSSSGGSAGAGATGGTDTTGGTDSGAVWG
jgi:uncharacterized cupredoxin-like copper-binding protein